MVNVPEIDMNIDDPVVRMDMEIIYKALVELASAINDLESRVEVLEAP